MDTVAVCKTHHSSDGPRRAAGVLVFDIFDAWTLFPLLPGVELRRKLVQSSIELGLKL